jgi:hypothetical protein
MPQFVEMVIGLKFYKYTKPLKFKLKDFVYL